MSLEVRIRKQVSKDFILDAELTCEKGILSLFGTHGSGKTLTLLCIAGAKTPDEGQILLDGRVLFDSMKKTDLPVEKRKIGCLFSEAALFPEMTLEENIRTALKAGDVQKRSASYRPVLLQETSKYLEQYQLNGLGGYYPEELSPLQRHRAAIARMFAAEPSFVLLDDPFRDLEGREKAQMLREIRNDLEKRGIPAIFASGDMDEVYAMSSRVSILKDGKTQAPQPRESFFEKPTTVAAAMLGGCENVTKIRLVDPRHALSDEWGTMFSFRSEDGEGLLELPAKATAVGIRASDFLTKIPEEPALETKENQPAEGAEENSANHAAGTEEQSAAGAKDKTAGGSADHPAETPEERAAAKDRTATWYTFSMYHKRVEEDMHDWIVYFLPGRKCNREMVWKIPRRNMTRAQVEETELLYISGERILILE